MELKDRIEQLRRLVAAIQSGAPTNPLISGAREPQARVGGVASEFRTMETPSGPVRLAAQRLPLAYAHAGVALGETLLCTQEPLQALARERRGFPGFQNTAFVDLETTGLAGGTGVLAFLVGIGRFDGDWFHLQQFFLHDPAEERAMLEAVERALDGVVAVVTFNGRCFDLPLLETRFAMNRLRSPICDSFHLDLLAPSRRLWSRSIGECSLPAIERRVLGFDRGPDVPGWMIPGIYASYLRSSDEAEVEPVVSHNRLDILTLATLLSRLGRCLAPDSPDPRRTAHEALGAASTYESLGIYKRAFALYEEALESGGLDAEMRDRALWGVVRASKRLRNWDGLLRSVTVLAESGTADPEAWIELAKHHEHRSRDLPLAMEAALKALELVETSSDIPEYRRARLRGEVEHRIRRLRRRMHP